MMRGIFTFAAALALVLSFAARTPASAGEKRVITIGYAYANLDENNKRTMNAIEKRVAEVNAARDDIDVQFIYTDGQSNVDKQLADVEAMIAKKPDIVMVSAVDLVGSIPAARAVAEAGIICVEDRGMKDPAISFQFQGMNEIDIKNMKKEWLKKYLADNPGKKLQFGLLYGLPAQVLQLIRNDDIKELAQEMPDRVVILDERYANWSTQEAMAITEDWMQRYPEMNAYSAASDDMILGAINALASAGTLEGTVTVAVDGTRIGMQLVDSGKLSMTVKALQNISYSKFVDICIEAVEGKFKEKYYSPGTDALVTVDKSNVADYKDIN